MLMEKLDVDGNTRPLRIAVCGEVSSGKSTILNTLLRAPVLPDNIGRSSRPIIQVCHRAAPGAEVLRSDGTHARSDRVDDPEIFREADHIRLWSDRDHLSGMELIEVPLTKVEDLTDAQVDLVQSSDVMIWVTIASQAWRLTEKTIVEALDLDPRQAILAVSRADKLRSGDDRTRLKDRLLRETESYFGACIFVQGSRRIIGDAARSDVAWSETGGTQIVAAIGSIAKALRERRKAEAIDPAQEVSDVDATSDHQPVPVSAAPEREAPAPVSKPLVLDTTARVPDPGKAKATHTGNGDISDKVVTFSTVRNAARDQRPANTDKARADTPAAPTAASSAISAPQPAAKIQTARADTASTPDPADRVAMLRTLAGSLGGAPVVGLCPADSSAKCEILAGDAEIGGRIGAFCQRSLQDLTRDFPPDGPGGPVTSLFLSTQRTRVLFQSVPGLGVVFLMVDAVAFNQGIAQSTLSRLCKVAEDAA